jgi:hypothetical protein
LASWAKALLLPSVITMSAASDSAVEISDLIVLICMDIIVLSPLCE